MKEKGASFIKWFSELTNKDVGIAGGKGASLAEMYNTGVPVPPGFVITAQAYAYFIEKTGISERIKEILSESDVDNTTKLNNASKKIREIIEEALLPKELENEILDAYDILSAKREKSSDALGILEGDEPFVAVRSSATTEDLADASFAGQQESFLNVRGKEQLLEKIKKCMSSLFTARAIYYRMKKGFAHDKTYLAVVVQKMINSTKSGVIFSQNPAGKDKAIIIEAVWGLGEGIVSGKIKPDYYVVPPDLENFKIKEIKVSNKKLAIVRNKHGKTESVLLNEEKARQRVLDNYEIKRLAQYAKQLEEHYKKPQDIEFAIDDSGIYLVQSRPITTTYKETSEEVVGKILLTGLGASPGIAAGKVKIIHDVSELEKVQKGDVLVAEMTNPDMVVSMEKAAAIITDEGGITSHAAIVSREMGIPAVVGTNDATKKLKDGDLVTVDGNTGRVFFGIGETKRVDIKPIVPTKIEIKVIVDLPHFAERAAISKAKAVGLLRLEGIIASNGKHPLKFVKEKRIEDYTKLIRDGIKKISEFFEEVWVRTSDIRSDEFRDLDGSPKEIEGNPMLGDHGIRFSLKHKEIIKAELNAIKEVAKDFPEKKFGVMLPQVISIKEVQETKKIAQEIGVPKNIHLGIMVETPAAVQIIEELCQEGISFISLGTNDLTQYTLAVDRNNDEVQDIYDEMHPAVLSSIKNVIRVCKNYGVKTSICGQAGSREDMARFLVQEGIDSISVNADAAHTISQLVAKIEKESGGESGSEVGEEFDKENESEDDEESAEEIETTKKDDSLFDDRDIEEMVLKELGNDEYMPGDANSKKNDIPPLNDAIPISSESFEED